LHSLVIWALGITSLTTNPRY